MLAANSPRSADPHEVAEKDSAFPHDAEDSRANASSPNRIDDQETIALADLHSIPVFFLLWNGGPRSE